MTLCILSHETPLMIIKIFMFLDCWEFICWTPNPIPYSSTDSTNLEFLISFVFYHSNNQTTTRLRPIQPIFHSLLNFPKKILGVFCNIHLTWNWCSQSKSTTSSMLFESSFLLLIGLELDPLKQNFKSCWQAFQGQRSGPLRELEAIDQQV